MTKLLSLGANVLQQGVQDGKTPLRKTVDYVQNYAGTSVWEMIGVLKEQRLVSTLLSAQVKSNNPLNAKCKSGISHLHIACMFNHSEAVQFFARFNEPLDQVINADSDTLPGYTPLHCAVRYSSSETAVVLLSLGANIYLENAQGINALCYLIERLLDANDYLNMGGFSYYLYEKEIERLDSIVKAIALKNRIGDSKLVENTGLSAFHLACTLKDNWIMQSYIKIDFEDINKPVSCKSKLWSGWTPLHFAACCNIQTFEVLLNNGADASIKNVKGETAFHLSLRRHSPKLVHSYVPKDIVLSDKTTQLSDLILSVSKYATCQQFLQNLRDVNLSVPLGSPVWPGYNLLHLSVSMKHEIKSFKIFRVITDTGRKIGFGVYLPQNDEPDFESLYWSRFEMSLKKGCSVDAENADGLTPIHLAYKLHEWFAIEKLLTHVHKNMVGPGNLSFLHIACLMGKKDIVTRLLEEGANVNSPVLSSFEWHEKSESECDVYNPCKISIRANSTPLHMAVIFKMEEVVEILLKKHADIHAEDEFGFTPLYLSLISTKSIAQLLLSGASNLKDRRREDGLSHLHVAAFADDKKAVQKLLKDGADINGFIKDTVPDCLAAFVGKTPLHIGVEGRKAMRILIKMGADIFAENPMHCYKTPLDLAVRQLKSRTSKFIFDKLKCSKTKIDALTESGLTTLHIACATFDLDWARKLLKCGANPNARMNDGRGQANTPMQFLIVSSEHYKDIISKNFVLLVELLSEYGADFTISNNYDTALHLFIKFYWKNERWFDSPNDEAMLLSIADLLLSNQRSYAINSTDSNGFSHFHIACITNNLVVIKNYLDNGVDINHSKSAFADQSGGYTPLHFAIKHKNLNVIELLVERGADVRAEDTNGNTPLHLAVISCFINLQLFDVLLKKGADINAKNLKNRTPIVCLLYNKNITYEQFRFFINRGSIIDFTDSTCESEGIIGLVMKNTKPSDTKLVFEILIELSSLKDAISKGFLVLHNIVSVWHIENSTRDHLYAIQRLLDKCINIDEQDNEGKTALDIAVSFRNGSAVEALLLLGANVNVAEDEEGSSSVIRLLNPYFFNKNLEIFVIKHLWKMTLVKLDLNVSIQKAMKKTGWKPNDNAVRLYQSELKKITNTRIYQSLTAKHFLSELGAVVEYRTMSGQKRQTVDNFFAQSNDLRKKFPEFAGLLTMQYKKALARVTLMQPVKDILVAAGINLPDLCLEAILKYFKNSELTFLIEGADQMPPPRKNVEKSNS